MIKFFIDILFVLSLLSSSACNFRLTHLNLILKLFLDVSFQNTFNQKVKYRENNLLHFFMDV